MRLILTHDVDWPRHGPGRSHVLARLSRFPSSIAYRILREGFNPYYGIPAVVEAEERVGARSTFFFRAWYDDGSSVDEYRDEVRDLLASGWEIGLHINDASSVEAIRREKRLLEMVTGVPVLGSRVHYLRVDENGLRKIAEAGFFYDSSIMYSKDRCDPRNTGFFMVNGLVVFPLTLMDAYLFTYMGLGEENVVSFILECLGELEKLGVEYATLLWHDNSIYMKGGRMYPRLLEELSSLDKIELLRMRDAYDYLAERRRNGV